MKKCIFIIIFFVTLNGCAKREFLPAPELILSLNSTTYNYFGSSTIKLSNNANYKILGNRGISSGINIPWAPDSMIIVFKSSLTDTVNGVFALLSIAKVFHRSQFDSTGYGWVLKNDDDFFSTFSKGKINVLNGQPYENQEGVGLNINVGGNVYQTHPVAIGVSHSYKPHLDFYNEFTIEDSHTEIDWGVLSLTGMLPNYQARKVLVNFSFKAKLVNNNNPNDSIVITNGRFQGFFADR